MTPPSNEVIKKNIVEQLAWNDAIDANKIQVEIKDKKVTLELSRHQSVQMLTLKRT